MQTNPHFYLSIIFLLFSRLLLGQTAEKEILWTADWGPNGKLVAIGGNVSALKIYDTRTFKVKKSYPTKNTITRVTWHPTKNLLGVATQISEDKCYILNVDTDEKIVLKGISPDGARGIDWNKSGELLAVGDNDGSVFIYNLKGELVNHFVIEGRKGITGLDWNPVKDEMIVISDEIYLLKMDGTLLKYIKHRKEKVMMLSVAWHPSGTFFVTGDYGDSVDKSLLQYWDTDGKLLQTIKKSIGEYRNLSWNIKGTKLASASESLRIWDQKGTLLSEGNSTEYLWGVTWNKKGNRIITTNLKQGIVLWDENAEALKEVE
jgi:WD40 repeat protein